MAFPINEIGNKFPSLKRCFEQRYLILVPGSGKEVKNLEDRWIDERMDKHMFRIA